MTTLFADDLAYLPGLARLRPPLASMPGTEVFAGACWEDWVRLELASGEGTPERRAWLTRAAKRHHIKT